MKLVYLLFIPVIRCMETCLIDCRNTTNLLPIVSSEVEVLLSASIGAYSVDYDEVCSMLPGTSFLASNPTSSLFYEFENPHISNIRPSRSYHGVCGANFTTSFDYLNASDSGAILYGEYTYGCATTDFFPDDSYFPRPEIRTQRCMYGLKLVPGKPNEFGAAFWQKKQPVAYGFDTSFKFRVLHGSKYCGLEQSPNQAKWCYKRGGRGFAFVIQNEGSPGVNGLGDELSYKLNGLGRLNLGYMFPRNLAVEFDYAFNTESNDPTWNHIAVMVPVVKQSSEADNNNLADHATNTLAMASGINLPPLHEGLHSVRVTYEVHSTDKWQHLTSDWYSRPTTENQRIMNRLWSHGKPGILRVFLDDQLVVKTLVDLAQVVQSDSVTSGSSGSAWIGFVAATSSDTHSSPLIVDWRWSSNSMCVADDPKNSETLTCARGHVVGDPDQAVPKFTLRNIGTVDIQVLTTLEDNQAAVCENGQLSWNQIHPYYLGCQRTVALGPNLTSLLISDTLGVRSLRLTDQTMIDRDYTGTVYLRREIPNYCVIEHESDPYRFYFAQCDCSFCARVFDNQQLYSVFYSQRCSERYTYTCSCFEVSQMAADTYSFNYTSRPNPWRFVSQEGYSFETKNMQFQRHSVCRGCKFDNHCSRLNKQGVCDMPETVYHVGNPLKPQIGGSFEGWSRGPGAEDGTIKGSACNCGDRGFDPFYLDTRGNSQLFPVYQLAYLQGTPLECANCLRLPGSNCAVFCGSPQYERYLHVATGQSCSTCMLSSSSLYDLTPARLARLRTCAYAAIEAGDDPWTACAGTVNTWLQKSVAEAQIALKKYLNGVATHFLTECPSRPIETDGAVCAPNLHANLLIPMQVLARGPAENSPDGKYFPVWWDGVACMNAQCTLQPRTDCYMKRYKLVFDTDPITGEVSCSDLLGSGLGCHIVGNVSFNASTQSAVFDKQQQQFVYTDALDRSSWSSDPSITGMKRKSLEVWASVSPVDAITDLNLNASENGLVTASSNWGMDYEPALAVDGSLTSFWQSATSDSPIFTTVWTIDFGLNVQHARGYTIHWEYRAVNYTVSIKSDDGNWKVVDRVINNTEDVNSSPSYFKFRKLKITMTGANRTRPAGQDENKFAYGIKEFEILTDFSVARLKPISVTQERNLVISRAIDGDLNTWWSTPPGVDNAVVEFTYYGNISQVALIRSIFRRGMEPEFADIEFTDELKNWTIVSCFSLGCDSDPIEGPDYIVSLSQIGNGVTYNVKRTKFRLTATQGAMLRGKRMVQLAEFEVYQNSSTSAAVFNPTACKLHSGQVCPSIVNGMGIVEAGSTIYLTNWTSITNLDSDETLGIFTIEFANSVPASIEITSPGTIIILPASTSVNASNVFAVVVNDITDLSLRIIAKPGSSTEITKAVLTPMKKVTLVNPLADSEWIETIPSSFPYQGSLSNLIDGDYRTDWRTELGAPALTGTSSIDLDYKLKFQLGKHFSVDMIYIEFSFGSDWFRLEGSPASATDWNPVAAYSCEWTPSLRADSDMTTGDTCKDGRISTVERDNYYRFTNRLVNETFWSDFSLTLMEVSALDTVADLPVIGIKEIEIFTANPAVVPIALEIDGFSLDPSLSALFDSNLGSEIELPPMFSGSKIWIDLGPERLERIEVWWSLNSSQNVPISTTVGVVTDPAVVACNDNDAAGLATDQRVFSAVPGSPILYTGPLGFIESSVRCVYVTLYSPVTVAVSEIVLARANPTVGASVAEASFLYAEQALDGDVSTSAIAVSANQLLDGSQYLMFDLASEFVPGTPVWGADISTAMIADGFLLDADYGITMFYCPVGPDLAACIASGVSVNIDLDLQEYFSIAPALACAGCSRIAIVFKPSEASLSITGDLFQVSEITIYASSNRAGQISEISFDDDRVWTNVITEANDGKSSTPWVSEIDVTDASVVISIIPDGDGLNVPAPTYVSSVEIEFFVPSRSVSLFSSLDGTLWNLEADFPNLDSNKLSVTNPFFAQYLKVSLRDPSVNASPLNAVWESSLFAISEITAITTPSLQTSRAVTASSSAVDSNYVMGGLVWLALPPKSEATFSLNPGTILAGVSLSWLFPPANFTVSFISGGIVVHSQSDSFIADPSVQTPSSFVTTMHGYPMPIDSVMISITGFKAQNFVEMAALSSIYFYEVSVPFPLAHAVAPASDDSPDYLTDGDLSSSYSSPIDTVGTVEISVPVDSVQVMGKLVIVWRSICADFSVVVAARTAVGGSQNVTLLTTTSNADALTEIYFSLSISDIFIIMNKNANGESFEYSLFEIQLWESLQITHTAIGSGTGWSNFQPESLNDGSNETMWMAAPDPSISSGSPVVITLDLGSVFKVKQVSVLWGWAPFANDWLETLLASRRDFQVSDDGLSFHSVVDAFHYNNTARFDASNTRLSFRFFRVVILAPYVDAELDPHGQIFGVSIRNVEVFLDDNIGRDNMDKVVLENWWNFPSKLTADGTNSTYWLSQRGQTTAWLLSDLGQVKTVAGVHLLFQYAAGTVEFYKSDDCSSFTHIHTLTGNSQSLVSLSGQDFQFRARCVKVALSNAQTLIPNPDILAGPSQAIFGAKMFTVMQHMGGGGLFGIEAKINGVWGSVFDSIVFAPFQPRQWTMLSNQQVRTKPVHGSDAFDDISNLVHVVASFNNTGVTLFRNGEQFGSEYLTSTIRWDMVEDVRLVLGVRSSAFVNNSNDASIMGYGNPGALTSYLDPFFSGQMKSAALISRALLPEEVRGLYLSGLTGERERGCHCFDACPVGRNRLYPDVDVPCSGQGVCRRAYDPITGMPTTGVCECNNGFFGPNCENHCSTHGGCCSMDDDCPPSKVCDVPNFTCVAPPR